MGLDIMLFAIRKEQNKEESFHEFIVEDETRFKKCFGEEFIKTKVNQYYNFEAIGITEDRYLWRSTNYEEDNSYWEYTDKENPFYKLLEKISNSEKEIDPSKLTDEVRNKLISNGILDYLKIYNTSSEDNLAIIDSNGKLAYYPIKWFLIDKSIIKINEEDIPLRDQEDKVVYGEEIGYQRKGLNGLFYDEYTSEDHYVFEKERLQYIYDHYVEKSSKQNFKEYILDKHIDGKTFVVFDW